MEYPLDVVLILTLFTVYLSYLIYILGDTTSAPFDLVESKSQQVVGLYMKYPTENFSLYYMADWYKYDNQIESWT